MMNLAKKIHFINRQFTLNNEFIIKSEKDNSIDSYFLKGFTLEDIADGLMPEWNSKYEIIYKLHINKKLPLYEPLFYIYYCTSLQQVYKAIDTEYDNYINSEYYLSYKMDKAMSADLYINTNVSLSLFIISPTTHESVESFICLDD